MCRQTALSNRHTAHLSAANYALKEPFIAPICPKKEESVVNFARRRLGHDIYRYGLILNRRYLRGEPSDFRCATHSLSVCSRTKYGGILRGSSQLCAQIVRVVTKVEKQIISFKNGLAELPQLLVAALGESAYQCIHKINTKIGADWRVDWNGKTHIYDEVLITTPSHALDKLPFDEWLLKSLQPLLAIDYSPVSVLTVAFKHSDVAHPLDGFGMLVPECRRTTLGILFPASLFANRAPAGEVLLTVFVGGERQAELAFLIKIPC